MTPLVVGRLSDALSLFAERMAEEDARMGLCPSCRRERGTEAHRPRCAYLVAQDVLLLLRVSTNRRDTIDEHRADVTPRVQPEEA